MVSKELRQSKLASVVLILGVSIMFTPGATTARRASLTEARDRIGELTSLNPREIREKSIQQYSPNVMAQGFIDLYQRVLNGGL